jgi:hypothetical protein
MHISAVSKIVDSLNALLNTRTNHSSVGENIWHSPCTNWVTLLLTKQPLHGVSWTWLVGAGKQGRSHRSKL